MKILVTGGLGFIGSHTVISLVESGFTPIILDDLSNSRIEVLEKLKKLTGKEIEFVRGNVNDTDLCLELLRKDVKGVIHFAAHKAVNESVALPLKYYQNNIGGLLSLARAMEFYNVENLVFSSSCTVYGEPDSVPVTENTSFKRSTSPYGATKQMAEVILEDLKWCNTQCLRYFNPIGAHPSGEIGELPNGTPSNLIPYLTQSAAKLRPPLTVHGNDYSTPDGTCIRDYIHVCDLADAHVAAMKRLLSRENLSHFETFNIGTGIGTSVLEILNTFEEVTGVKPPFEIGPRREGDIERIWAESTKSEKLLKWKAKRNLKEMLRDAWNWQQSRFL
jgi:UDP-glucose 4-epimerase